MSKTTTQTTLAATPCVACGRRADTIDFHHWDYGPPEPGCHVCRSCHDWIHWGRHAYPSNCKFWVQYALQNLLALHWHYNGPMHPYNIVQRYNIPYRYANAVARLVTSYDVNYTVLNVMKSVYE